MTLDPTRRQFSMATAAAALWGAAPWTGAQAAPAQPYPDRPLHLVSPYPPGGTNDLVARVAGRKLATLLGQPVVIENRGGAGGTLGTASVVQSAADGYTVLHASSGNLSSAPQVLGASYNPLTDLVPVGFLGHIRSVFAVHPSVPVNTLAEFIAYAKQNPGRLNYGTAGNGTGAHIGGEYLRLRTGIDIVHVPYRGSALAVNDAMAGHVQLVIDPLAAQYVRAGKLRGLAYAGATSAPDLPGVPSIDAAGLPNWEATNFYLAALPAKTPLAVREVLVHAFDAVARDETVVAELRALGVEIAPLSPAQIKSLLVAEIAVNDRVIRAAGIQG